MHSGDATWKASVSCPLGLLHVKWLTFCACCRIKYSEVQYNSPGLLSTSCGELQPGVRRMSMHFNETYVRAAGIKCQGLPEQHQCNQRRF